ALIVRSASKVTPDVLQHAENLRIIGRAGTGVDNIDLTEATRRGILVTNAPDANTISVADHTIAMLLALCRHLPFAHGDLKQGRWEKKKYEGVELEDKAVGVLGLGRIGREVVKRLRGFSTRILAYDPFVSERVAKELEVELLPLEKLLATADFVSLHMPLLPDTIGFLNRERFSQMKKGIQVINCARGELIDEAALLEALENGTVAGAALDVFSEEPPKSELLLKIVHHPHVILTPHLAASTLEAQEKVGYQIAVQIRDYLKDGTVRNPVNFYSMTREEFTRNQPYMMLGERLGSFLAQIAGGGYQRFGIEFRGAVAHLSKEAILQSVLKGLLASISTKVNIVNALSLARERGIEIVSTVKEQDATFSSLLAVTLETDRSRHKVTGTVFEKELIRLISYDDVYLDFRPQGTLLFFKNHDTPGVVGKIGTLLGTSGINIGSMKLGRVPEAGFAYGVVNVDGELPDSVVQNLRKFPEIVEARALHIV
ncbi:MAG TPA: phosphoglycerate dehydrogenase, partial [Acidobacteriota bacterium]|nr:phosphoglycerate dehydrogenase [Acidobacteriota bacterium]